LLLRYRIAHAAKGYGVKKPKTQTKNQRKRNTKLKHNKPYKVKETPMTLTEVQHISDYMKNGKTATVRKNPNVFKLVAKKQKMNMRPHQITRRKSQRESMGTSQTFPGESL
jgi:hypothetical protein